VSTKLLVAVGLTLALTGVLRAQSGLPRPAEVGVTDPDGTTPLHRAAARADVESARLLIGDGASVRAANRYGVTPLTTACATGNAAMIELLLEAGADPNSATPEGETALMTVARTGAVEAVTTLLTRGADVNAKEAWRGQTAIMWAAGEGHTATVEQLVRRQADVRLKSKGGLTALMFAVRGGHLDTVRTLLSAGADVNDMAADGSSALAVAIINANYEVAALLLDRGADPNAPDPRGSALHALTWMRNPGYAAAPPRQQTGNLDSLELAKALLAHRANPNARVSWKEIRFDRDLGTVKAPPDISIGRAYLSYVGATPFYLAAKGADVLLMKLLVAHGADPLIPTVQKVTPMMAAAGLGFWDGESPGPESGVPESQALEAVKLTFELGNDMNATTDFGPTPIEGESAVLLHRHPLYLLKFGDTALGDMRWGGSTALHGAAIRGADSIVRFLVERGARVDAPNILGWTPLTVAQGVFVANTEKANASTIALLRELGGNTHPPKAQR